jgi:molybdopterin converting factor small subunit
MPTVRIPTPLRAYTDKQASVTVEGATVGEALEALTTRHEGLRRHLRDANGNLRGFINIFVGDEDIRYLEGKEAFPLAADAEITIVPSIAGGAPIVARFARSKGRGPFNPSSLVAGSAAPAVGGAE